MRTTTSTMLIAALAAAVALGGCASSPTVGTSPGPTATDCGRVELGLGSPAVPKDALDCFTAGAASGGTTTLAVVMSTTEGDPITTTYRASSTEDVEVVVDSTQDTFAGTGAGVTTQTCRYTVTATEIQLRACTDPKPA